MDATCGVDAVDGDGVERRGGGEEVIPLTDEEAAAIRVENERYEETLRMT